MTGTPSRAQRASANLRAAGIIVAHFLSPRRWRKPLSGVRRKKLSQSFLTFQLWKTIAQKRFPRTRNFLTTEALMQYISRIDDILDQARKPSFVKETISYRKDELARKHMSNFVRSVKKSPLSAEEKREIFAITSRYRLRMKSVLEKFEEVRKPTFDEIVEMRRLTSGETGRVLAAILNISEKIPREKRFKIERAFFVTFLAQQVADDVRDAKADFAQNVPNLVTSALSQNIWEFIEFKRAKKINRVWLVKHAPQTYAKLTALFDDYQSSMPLDEAGYRALAAISTAVWKLS